MMNYEWRRERVRRGWRRLWCSSQNCTHGKAGRFGERFGERRAAGVIARASTEIYPLDPPWLSEALVFIHRSVPEGISAQDVVAHLGRSHTLVARVFREKLGQTIQQVIAQARLDLAKQYLADTTLSITEIARRCGFRTTTYFLQAFSAAHHLSPGAWREENKSSRHISSLVDRLLP